MSRRPDSTSAGTRPSEAGRRGGGGRRGFAALVSALTAALTVPLLGAAPASEARPGPADGAASITCPEQLAAASCYAGQDAGGSYYTIAVPEDWNGSLVVHAHGGPDLSPPSTPERSLRDLERWAVMVDEGYAWAGSSYRRGGYGTRMAAEDTENVRLAFNEQFGKPAKTYLHGQSWGGNVAAKVLETYGRQAGAYDGALLTNGVLAGGSRGYDYRVDLRAVYQYYCRNLPRPSEEQYPLWQGLPADSDLTTAEVRARLDECTGYAKAPAERTAVQQRNLDDILAVTGVPEATLESHLRFSVFTFRDIVHNRLDGRNPFGNRGVRYSGSHDDVALNRGVERFHTDRTAARDLSFDSDLTGDVRVPVLTLHAIGDPTAYVEHAAAYRATLRGAGREHLLAQSFTRESDHSGLSASGYAASMAALDGWVTTGRKATPAAIAAACPVFDEKYGTGCFHDPAYVPASYASRVEARPGGHRWPVLTSAQERRWSGIEGVGIAP